MLAAISTTTLSRRSCALTGSAITSRSRRNSTRGPPSAPRIFRSLTAHGLVRKSAFRGRAFKPGLVYGPIMYEVRPPAPAPAAVVGSGYSQWPMQGASQSPVNGGGRLRLIQPVQAVQRAHRQVALRGVDQHRELDLGG